MNAIGTGYRLLGVIAVLVTVALAAGMLSEGLIGPGIALATIGGAIAGIFWRVGTVINGGVAA